MNLRGWVASFRARFLLVVLAVTVLPLGLVGLWLTGAAVRAGEELITERVELAVGEAAEVAGARWLAHRSGLLDVAADEVLWSALARAISEATYDGALPRRPPDEVVSVLRSSRVPLGAIVVRDSLGMTVWEDDLRDPPTRPPGPALVVGVDVFASPLGPRLGTLQTELAVVTLVPDNTPAPGGVGTLLGVYESGTGTPLAPLPFSLEDDRGGEVFWGGDRWITARRELVDPPLTLVATAPLSPYTAPYLGAARRGATVLALVGALALALTLALTNRMTTSLERLASAAEAVSGGDLDRTLDVRGDDEVSRVGRAFNQMTDSLKTSLQELADTRALAAVGEFAAQLAHEIRNPLSAVRIDMQMVEEELAEGSRLRVIQARAISEIQRLDATVRGALRTARSGRAPKDVVDVHDPLRAAALAARTTAGPESIEIDVVQGEGPVWVNGDAGALEQIFLNLLLNAVEASYEGGRVTASLTSTDHEVQIEVVDHGVGISPEVKDRMYDPLYTTRRDGTGLGLTIAHRLVLALGGSIELESVAEGRRGTIARVLLPRTPDVAR